MKTNQKCWWRKVKERLVCWWKISTSPSSGIYIKPTSLPQPIQKDQRTFPNGHKELVTRIQQWVGLSPTEGHELVRDLHLTKCRSSEVGAPRPTAKRAWNEIERVGLILSMPTEEAPQENQTAEDIRNLTRAAICDIMTYHR